MLVIIFYVLISDSSSSPHINIHSFPELQYSLK